VIEERFLGSSGRSSIRLSFNPKSWQEIINGIHKTIIGSTLATMFYFYLYYYYTKKAKKQNIPENPNFKELLHSYFPKKDNKS